MGIEGFAGIAPLRSTVCRYEHFLQPWYAHWCSMIGFPVGVSRDVHLSYRKIWEWCAIMQALDERGMLQPGRRGIGFAVGTETLPAIFARLGATIVATDLPQDLSDGRWEVGNQHAASLEALFFPNHCHEEAFRERVSFQPVDMRNIDHLPDAAFDFAWSSCAIEHLGTLEAGMAFARNVMRILKPGGVAVHTTEFNCSSNDDTITEGWNVVYRQQDLERLDRSLRIQRCGLERLDFNAGTHEFDLHYDTEPYFAGSARHIKLQLGDYVATSFLIIANKAE